MRIYLKNVRACKFHLGPIWNDGALRGSPQQEKNSKKKNNKPLFVTHWMSNVNFKQERKQ